MVIEIYGDYVDGEAYGEQISPTIFREQIKGLKENEALEVRINSMGGSVTAGVAIANTIRELSNTGHETTCVIDGVAASIASISAMACDRIVMYPSSFLMIHNPWTMLMGDATTLRKEADTLDKMRSALVSFYRRKFARTDEEIISMMDAETWISGREAEAYGLTDIILVEDSEFANKVAAKAMKKVYTFRNNRGVKTMIEKEIEEIEKEIEKTEEKPEETKAEEVITPEKEEQEKLAGEADIPEEEKVEKVEKAEDADDTTDTTDEKTEEEKEPTVEELKAIIAELEEKIKELEAEKEAPIEAPIETPVEEPVEARVAKCQSVFQKKINDLKCEMQSRDEELQKAKAAVSRLEDEMKKSTAELAKAQAAEVEAKSALAMLTGGALNSPVVSTYAEKMAQAKTPAEREKLREMKKLGKIA